MKKNTFKILFHIRGNRTNKDGKASIIARIAINGEYERISTTLSIEPELWDVKSMKAIGRSAKILEINKRLDDMRVVLKEHYYEILNRHGYVTAEMVKNAFTGITAKEESLVPLYLQHLEETKKLIGINKANPTYQKYERMYRRVVEFMKKKYNITDIPLREIKYKFILDLEFFLRTEYKYSQNTTYKCMKFFKQIINKAIRAGLIFVDPFNGYKISVQRVDRGFLTEDDLKNGTMTYRRHKTGQQLSIEWTNEMQLILDKYPENRSDYLLPIIKNSGTVERCTYRNVGYNINHNLKKLAAKARIDIPLTLYVARHSWASAAKAKGIPIAIISEGLGHDSETTTQIYLASLDASVVDKANSLIMKSLK